jgi:hypothetical protein
MAQRARSCPKAVTAGSSAGAAGPPLPTHTYEYERHPGAASAPLSEGYRRREPEKTVLHGVVREHLETFLAQARRLHGEGYPRFIEREFRRYLDCGLLCHGFARLRCPGCGHEQLLVFSYKGRLCPSCVGRRMADTAAYLVDQLLPEADYRQWVLTFPWALRFRLAVDRLLFTALLRTFLRTLFAWQRHRGRTLGIRDGQTGAVSFLQRFGGALDLHPHIHSLLPDGLFVPADEGLLTFIPLPPPTDEDVAALALKIARRLTTVIERRCDDACETDSLLEQTAAALQQALAVAAWGACVTRATQPRGSGGSAAAPGPIRKAPPAWCSSRSTSCGAWPRSFRRPMRIWSGTMVCLPTTRGLALGCLRRRRVRFRRLRHRPPPQQSGPAQTPAPRRSICPRILPPSAARLCPGRSSCTASSSSMP